MNGDILLRIRELIKLYSNSQTDFSKKIGISQPNLSKILSGERPCGEAIINKIVISLDINKEWLLTGEGEMLKDSATNNTIDEENKKISPYGNNYTTYLLPMSAMGGSLTGFAAPGTTINNCETVVSPIENVDFAITVYGDSMAPEYPSGSRILIKKINPNIFIEWGKVYVLDTENGVIVKEIHQSETKGYISCYSINPDPKYKPFDILMSEIYGMYRVLMSLSLK